MSPRACRLENTVYTNARRIKRVGAHLSGANLGLAPVALWGLAPPRRVVPRSLQVGATSLHPAVLAAVVLGTAAAQAVLGPVTNLGAEAATPVVGGARPRAGVGQRSSPAKKCVLL